METHSPDAARPDGELRYRVDSTGERVAILPATCKLGLHSLDPGVCRAVADDGEVQVSCPACAAFPEVDHSWRLTFSGTSPIRAELDDEPYCSLLPHRSRASVPR
jgi:hypothetical protein